MALTTVTVSIAANLITGGPLPNGRVLFEMTAPDIDGAIVVPGGIAPITLDANGTGSVTLWSNSRGTQGTQYRYTLVDEFGVMQSSGTATVPATNCNLHEILNTPAPQPVGDAQAAANASQASALLAKQWATQTSGEVVTGQGYGAKKYAQDAQAALASAIAISADLPNLDGVAAALPNINSVAGDLPNVDTVAGAIASVTSVATNMTAIIDAPAQATAAAVARAGAEAARDVATAAGPKYVDEPTGRAAVADGAVFLVQGAGNIAAYEYRRVNSGTSTLIATYPSKAFIDSITALLQSGGLQIYSGAGPIYPIAADTNGNMVLGYDSANNTLVGAGLVAASSIIPNVESGLLGPAGQASYVGAGPIYPVVTDQRGKVLIGYDSANNVIVAPGLLTRSDVQTIAATPSTLSALASPPVAKAINHLLFYGESTSVGAKGTPVDSTAQPYSNITFHGGPRAWTGAAWDFTAFKALVEDAVSPAPDTATDRGETCCSGAANYAITLAAQENGLAPSSHVILASTAGHGSYKISNLVKGQAWYSTLTSHVSGAKALNADYAVHAVGLNLGINDAAVASQTPYATYRAAVEQLQVDAETDIKAITGQTAPVYFLMNQISYAGATWPDEALAQLDLAQKNSKFVLITPMYHIPTASDAIHNTADGYKWLGAYFGRAYKQMVIDGKRPKWLNPLSATIRGAVIRVRFDVPFAPMVLDVAQLASTTNYGFKVLDGATPATINSVAIDGSDVLITLSATPAGAVTVRYGLDYLGTGLNITGGASGNLRDSDPGTITVSGIVRPLFHVCPHFKLTATVLGE